jgi:hypothetical protein
MKVEKRFSRGVTTNFQSEPRQGFSDSCAKSFRGGFLCGKTCGEWDGGAGLSAGIFDFGRVENLFEEAISKTLEGFFDPVDFDQVHAKAKDSFRAHFFLMARRKSRTLCARPTVMACETKECPMFNVWRWGRERRSGRFERRRP